MNRFLQSLEQSYSNYLYNWLIITKIYYYVGSSYGSSKKTKNVVKNMSL